MDKKRKMTFMDILSAVFPMLTGAVMGISLVKTIKTSPLFENGLLSFLFVLFIMYIVMVLQIIIHEAGHLIFGLLTGYEFRSFRIFSLLWIKQGEKIKLKRHSVPGTVGQCLLSPPNIEDMHFVLYNLGGVILNLISSAICAIIATIFFHSIYLNIFFEAFVLFGICFALTNGVPLKMGMINNDGYNLVCILKDSSALKSLWVQLKVSEQLSLGKRLVDLPKEWFELPDNEQMKNGLTAAMAAYHCNYLMEQKEFQKFIETSENILNADSGMIGLHRKLLVCDQIYCLLITGNVCKATELMLSKECKKFMASMKQNISIIRTEYAFALLVEKDAKKTANLKNTLILLL